MRCQDVMKRPVQLCHDYDTVQVAARRMADANIGFVPVCDRNDELVGTLTDRDIAIRIAAMDRAASETRIGDVMTKEIVSCRTSDDIGVAERLMAEHHKSRIIVMSGAAPAGIISLSDLAAVDEEHAIRTLRSVAARETAGGRAPGLRP